HTRTYASSSTSISPATLLALWDVRALRASSITGGLSPVLSLNQRSHFFLLLPQHFWRIHLLPPTLAHIDGTHFIVASHQSNSISQAAVVSVTAGLRSFEIVEDFEWANKQTDINRVVALQIFADADHLVLARLNFHGVIQIDNRVELPV